MNKHICHNCKRPYIPKPHVVNSMYCSKRCKAYAWWKKQPKIHHYKHKTQWKRCPYCQGLFRPKNPKYHYKKFCDKKCQKKYWDKYIKFSPKWNDVPFIDNGFLMKTYLDLKQEIGVGR